MNQLLISVIIPAYNTSTYLDRCLKSLIAQTYAHLEIIIIDDGSTDDTPNLCKNWAMKDNRIKVINQTNQGLAEVCNVGVKVAQGELIGFVDSDDWIEPTMLEELYNSIQANNADIAVCGVILETEEGKFLKRRGTTKRVTLDKKNALIDILIDKKEKNYRWNKLYRKKLFNEVIFPKGRVFEDLNTVYKLYANAEKVSFVGKDLYHYIQRTESIIGTKNLKKEMDFFTANVERFQFISDFPEFSKNDKKMLHIRTLKRLLRSSDKIYKMTLPTDFLDDKGFIISIMKKLYRSDFTFKNHFGYMLHNYFCSIPYLNKLL